MGCNVCCIPVASAGPYMFQIVYMGSFSAASATRDQGKASPPTNTWRRDVALPFQDARGEVSIIRKRDGTAFMCVTPCVSICSRRYMGFIEPPSLVTINLAPATKVTKMSITWGSKKNWRGVRNTESGPREKWQVFQSTRFARAEWGTAIAFGIPVEPDVKTAYAIWLGPTEDCRYWSLLFGILMRSSKKACGTSARTWGGKIAASCTTICLHWISCNIFCNLVVGRVI